MKYQNLKILFKKNELFKLSLILFASLFSTLFEVIGLGSIPIFAMLITDTDALTAYLPSFISTQFINEMDDKKLILAGASILGLFFIFKNLYLFLLLFFQGKIIKDLRLKMTNKIFKYYVNLPYIEYSNLNPGIIIRRVQADITNVFVLIVSYITLIREVLILIAVFFLLMLTDPLISAFALIFLAFPVLIFYYFYRNNFKKRGKLLVEENGKKNIIVEQSLGAIKETKILNRENYFINFFSKITKKLENTAFFIHLIAATPRLFLEVAALLSVVVISVILVLIGRPSATIIPIISLLSVSAIRLIPGLNLITSSLTTIKFVQEPFDIVVKEVEKMNLQNDKLDFSENLISKLEENTKFNNSIYLKDVSFNYKNSNRIAVNDINIEISKGTSVGIIGRSGAGKSTLVDIILGLIDPNSGEIKIDDKKINNNEKMLWQKQIGYVPQNIYLLDDTIKNNIIFGIDEQKIDEKLLTEVIEISQLKKFISTLPNDINTQVGNRGAKLSGGERQRIGIARALYNQPKIMIFDEATSSLDIDNENKILDEIYQNKKNKTLIIVSHRNNTVKYCDSIYVMEDGKVIDNGSFEVIMKKYDYLKEDKVN